jgi:hypothetical protein
MNALYPEKALLANDATARNCPFYGYAMFTKTAGKLPFVLIASGGNQCGLRTDAHAPCHMEMNQLPVEWRDCPYVKDVRLGEPQ